MTQVKEPRIMRNISLIAFIGAFFEPLVGVILGHIALYEYKRSEGVDNPSRGFAIAGLVVGYVGLLTRLGVLGLVFLAGMAQMGILTK
jgi:hypothetical protein